MRYSTGRQFFRNRHPKKMAQYFVLAGLIAEIAQNASTNAQLLLYFKEHNPKELFNFNY